MEYWAKIRKLVGHERLQLVGASVFVCKNGKLLLQKRTDGGGWGEPGGFTDLAETVEETARRELFEETGLTANSLELLGVFSGAELFHTYPNGDMVSNVTVAYLCRDFSGELALQSAEVAELQWFGLENLPSDISPPSKPVLRRCVEILQSNGIS